MSFTFHSFIFSVFLSICFFSLSHFQTMHNIFALYVVISIFPFEVASMMVLVFLNISDCFYFVCRLPELIIQTYFATYANTLTHTQVMCTYYTFFSFRWNTFVFLSWKFSSAFFLSFGLNQIYETMARHLFYVELSMTSWKNRNAYSSVWMELFKIASKVRKGKHENNNHMFIFEVWIKSESWKFSFMKIF